MKNVILILITDILLVCFGCNNNLNTIEANNIDTIIKIQQSIADSFFDAGQLDSAKVYYLNAARYAMQFGDACLDILAVNLGNAGYCSFEQDKYEEAISFYKDALRYLQKTNNLVEMANIYSNLGGAQMLKSDYPGALESFMAALKIDEQINNMVVISTDYNNLGKLYDAWKNYNLSGQYYRKALEIDIANNDSAKIPIRLNSLGMLFYKQKFLDSALVYLNQALSIDEKLKNQKNIAIRKSNIGQILIEKGHFKEAELNLVQALQYFTKKNIEKSMCITQNSLADAYYHLGNYKNATDFYLKSLTISESINYQVTVAENYKDLANLYEKMGNTNDALRFFKKSKSIGDSLFTSENQQLINEYHVKYETEVKERKVQEQKIALQKSEYRSVVIGIISTVFLILSVFLFILFRTKRKTSKLLESKNKELAQTNATKDKLFSVIAHDLKNNVSGIFNLSSSINQNFELITNHELKNYLQQLEQASIDLRALLLNLLQWAMGQNSTLKIKSEKIDIPGLIDNVADQLNNQALFKNSEIRIDVPVFSFTGDRQILRTVLLNLVGNAIKFSKNGRPIDIRVKKVDGKISFEVEDYGIGIKREDIEKLFRADVDSRTIGNSPDKGTGLGLILCRDLLKHLNGTIFVESTYNQGSKFVFEIPSNPNE